MRGYVNIIFETIFIKSICQVVSISLQDYLFSDYGQKYIIC